MKVSTAHVRSYEPTDKRKVVLNADEWIEERSKIQEMISRRATLEFIAAHYEVSRQRIHQVMKQLKISVKRGTN